MTVRYNTLSSNHTQRTARALGQCGKQSQRFPRQEIGQGTTILHKSLKCCAPVAQVDRAVDS